MAVGFLILLFAIMWLSLAVYTYNYVSYGAREGSRYAAVHGTDYAKDTGNPAATPQTIYDNAIQPYAVAFNLNQLNYSVTWNASNQPYQTTIVNNNPVANRNTVTVTLTYQWIPEAFLGGVTLHSTSVLPMSY